MELIQVIKQQADFARKSCAEVTLDARMPWVTIADTTGHDDEIFLQGGDAEEFIARVDELQTACPDANIEDCELSIAYSYIENLWG